MNADADICIAPFKTPIFHRDCHVLGNMAPDTCFLHRHLGQEHPEAMATDRQVLDIYRTFKREDHNY